MTLRVTSLISWNCLWPDLFETSTIDINAMDNLKRTPLHYTTAFDSIHVAKLFLEQKSLDINVKDQFEQTPLHCGALRDSSLLVSTLLVENGADLGLRDKWGDTPLGRARKYNATKVQKLLQSVNAPCFLSWNPCPLNISFTEKPLSPSKLC